jgi:hypothetical protein
VRAGHENRTPLRSLSPVFGGQERAATEREETMPWEITVKRADGTALGGPELVQREILRAFPSVQFYREPSGPEKLSSLPAGVDMPEILRKHLEQAPPELQGDLDAGEYSLRFYLGALESATVEAIAIEARGNSRPAIPGLEALTLTTGWIIVDSWGNVVVENGHAIPEAR